MTITVVHVCMFRCHVLTYHCLVGPLEGAPCDQGDRDGSLLDPAASHRPQSTSMSNTGWCVQVGCREVATH
jgi:hypothetical protein